MSEISNLTTALGKMKAAVKDALSAVNKESDNVMEGVNAVSELVKRFESKFKDRSKIEEEKKKKAAQVEREIADLEKKKSLAQTTYAERTSDTEQTREAEQIERTLESKKGECTSVSKQISELERSINDKRREVEKLKSDLQSIKKKHDSDIRSLRESHDKAESELASKDAQHQALKLLMKEKAVTFPELKIMDVLREQNTTTMEHIQSTTQLKKNDIEDFVKTLAKRAILQYDSKAGDIRVLRPLEP